jgi:diacylglycerol kinase (ATP)
MAPPYPHVHVVINPASGPNRPILNTLNDVFRKYGVDWDVSITKRYGDATRQAKDAVTRGVDLVVGYGGDGTQHELANAVIGTATPATAR